MVIIFSNFLLNTYRSFCFLSFCFRRSWEIEHLIWDGALKKIVIIIKLRKKRKQRRKWRVLRKIWKAWELVVLARVVKKWEKSSRVSVWTWPRLADAALKAFSNLAGCLVFFCARKSNFRSKEGFLIRADGDFLRDILIKSLESSLQISVNILQNLVSCKNKGLWVDFSSTQWKFSASFW